MRITPAFARCAPFGLFIALLIVASAVSVPWLVVARNVLVAAALLWLWPRYEELRRPSLVRPTDWLLAVVAGLGVFGAWIWLDHDWAVVSRSTGFDPTVAESGVDWSLALPRLAGFALVVPLMEEIFWRSFLLRWLKHHDFLGVRPSSVGWQAFAVTTILFAVEHNQWLAGALAGAVYNALYMRSGNLWVPIVAHALTNAALGVWILATGSWEFW